MSEDDRVLVASTYHIGSWDRVYHLPQADDPHLPDCRFADRTGAYYIPVDRNDLDDVRCCRLCAGEAENA